MSYQVLARKWRPQIFEDVIGQEHITHTLMNAVQTGRLAHAYLFGGPRGVGKTSVARILAKAMNCMKGESGAPCNECLSCLEITDGSSVDVQEIDGASNRGIDEIRELRDNIKYMPSSSKYRVYIIDEVHMLTLPAFNALLKTLEEPPSHVKFIFATTEAHKVPITILSRCQRFDFKRIPLAQIVAHLRKITREEGFKINDPSLALVAGQAEGSMRDAESLLDQVISFTGSEVEVKHVIEVLGVMDREIIFKTSRAIIEGSPTQCLEIVDQIYNQGYDLKEFYRALMNQFRNLLVTLIASHNHLIDMDENHRKEAEAQANTAGPEKLQMVLNFLINREERLRFTSHPRLLLETAMIKLCRLDDLLSFEKLLEKVESLEKKLMAAASSPLPPKACGVSDTGVSWTAQSQEKPSRQESNHPGKAKTWDDFMIFLASKSKATYNILKEWQVLNLSEETLEIAKCNKSFSSTYFDDPERYAQLVNYCRDFFQRDLRIKIAENSQAPSQQNVSSDENHSDLPRPVQDILHMFQGEIKENPSDKNGGTP